MGGFSLLVELHRQESAPSACAADLFDKVTILRRAHSVIRPQSYSGHKSVIGKSGNIEINRGHLGSVCPLHYPNIEYCNPIN